MMDSIFSYSDTPILVVLWVGVFGCLVSIALGLITLAARLLDLIREPGYTTLMIIGLFYGSTLLVVQGIIGCYLWRAFENTKRRPLRIISHVISAKGKPHD